MRASKSGFVLWTVCLLLVSVSRAAFGQAPAAAPAGATGLRVEVTRVMEDAETKLTRLAEAIPASKYSWSPGKDVRSVSQVFLHVAGGNFFIPSKFGTEPPADFKRDGYDKSTSDKAKVVDDLKRSFTHAKQAVMKLTDADLEKTTQWFDGRTVTYRQLTLFLAAHQHEHLGQAIAYARSIGVVPPWTEEQQKKMPKPKS